MYLIDTNIISEARKKDKAEPGVRRFFAWVEAQEVPVYLSVVTIGELRRGIELIRHRGDATQAQQLAAWLETSINGVCRVHLTDGRGNCLALGPVASTSSGTCAG